MKKPNYAKELSRILSELDYEMAQGIIQSLDKDNQIMIVDAENTSLSDNQINFELEFRLIDRWKYAMEDEVEYILEEVGISNFLLQIEIEPTLNEMKNFLASCFFSEFEQKEIFYLVNEILEMQFNSGAVAHVFSYFHKVKTKWMVEDTQGILYCAGKKVTE
jgi:hypothetical protein